MNPKKFFFLIFTCIILSTLSSCFQIIEEINLKNNGTGNVTLTLNLSQSKSNVSSILLLDSVQGHKIPSKAEIQRSINEAVVYLKKSEGISNVSSTTDFNNYIVTIRFMFKKISNINNVTSNLLKQYKVATPAQSVYDFNLTTKTFTRKYETITAGKKAYSNLKTKDKAVFNGADYTSIYRFESPVTNITNPKSNLSKTKMAVMLKTNITDLINGKINISNTIQISK
ncbi:hypothetical protein [Pedobacter sp. MW01-1-1]|uniref:hypothetical protein n=1 Tax=Pedobacter sp. MW01-1-1 TaxID=3383027 RepID=UPI003FEE0749